MTTPTAVFRLPQASTVGVDGGARAHAGPTSWSTAPASGRCLHAAGAERRTMMKLVVERGTDRVLGCHMVGDTPWRPSSRALPWR